MAKKTEIELRGIEPKISKHTIKKGDPYLDLVPLQPRKKL